MVAVTIELLRRVLLAELAPREVVEAALLEAVRARQPLLGVLVRRHPVVAAAIERELGRAGVGEVDVPIGDEALAAACPAGLLETLGVIPLGCDPATGEILAAAADPFDQHAAEELAYHLGGRVLLLRASFAAVQAALGALRRGGDLVTSRGTSEVDDELDALRPPRLPALDFALPHRARSAPTAVERSGTAPSEPPIPLVRRSLVPRAQVPEAVAAVPASDAAGSGGGWREGAAAGEGRTVFDELGRARCLDEIVAQVMVAAREVAEAAVVFTVHDGELRGRAASSSLANAAAARRLVLPKGSGTVLARALRDGHYLGSLPRDAAHRELAATLGAGDRELYAVTAVVGGRPALAILAIGMAVPSLATRSLDAVSRAAADAMVRLVRERRRR